MKTTPPTLRRRPLAPLLAFLVLAQVLGAAVVLGPTPEPASAAPSIRLTKDAPPTVLAGKEATYRLTVTNPGDTVEYNVSLSDVLPFGAAFVPGSVVPATAGNPTVSTDPATGAQVLVWSNLTDVGPGGSYELEFQATLGETGQLVGESVINTAHVAAQTDPRVVPDFDESGLPVAGSYSESAEASRTTGIGALLVEKSSGSTPEGELLRGVHDHRSTYTLTVTNNDVAATNGVELVDLLPAGLEFLGCGDVDNTQPPTEVEYPGAPRLGVPPLSIGPSCVTPVSVETVSDPPPERGVGFARGVYTRVTWSLGDLAPGASTTVRYVAGVPLRENTVSWPGGVPDPASGEQAANLDNNTGASTRELTDEASLTNRALATGTYTGPTTGDPSVDASTSHTGTVEDVRMRKSVAPDEFRSDDGADVATFTIEVESSEYVSGSGLVVTDVLPDGYCPLGGSSNVAPGAPAECDPGGGSAPSVPFDQVSYDAATGAYTIRFEALSLTADDAATITFQARMRDAYTGGTRAGRPTVAGDRFTNRVSLSGTTSPVAGTGESGTTTVTDRSSATQTTAEPGLDKELKPRSTAQLFTGDPLVDCATSTPPSYGEPSSFDATQLTFRQGDQICFRLRVDFPDTVHTRAPVVTDFFPVDTRYLVGSWATTASNSVTVASFSPPVSAPGSARWVLGDDDGGVRFAAPGDVFEVVLAVTVLEPSPPPQPDVRGNLMKLRNEDTAGNVLSSRDAVDFDIAPGANLALTKGVYAVDAPPSGPNAAGVDGATVQEGSVATYRIDLRNLGRDGYPGANFSVRGVTTWDVLPPGIDCADVSGFGVVTHGTVPPATTLSPTPLPGGIAACTDPGDAGHPQVDPAYGDSAAQSVIVWTFPDPDLAETYSILVGETMTLTYDMALPSEISVSSRFDNTAAVRSFRSFTNVSGQTSGYYPADNVDPSVQGLENVEAADDPSWVVTSDVGLTKGVTTQVTGSGNNASGQATIGEELTYTIGVTVPPRTTVHRGVLTDPMPTGVTFLSATAGFSATGAAPVGPLPGGFTLDPANGTLTFPTTYQNATGSPQLFQVTITARVSTLASNTHGTVRTNTASFDSASAPIGGTALPTRTARSAVTVVEPNPRLQKSASPTEVIGGQSVQFTLVASNANGRPTLQDPQIVDCLPAGLTFQAFISLPAGSTSATAQVSGGEYGCAAGNWVMIWEGSGIAGGAAGRAAIVYSATVDPNAVGGSTYVNTATLTGGTLDNGSPTPGPLERTYTRTAEATLTVTPLGITKGVSPAQATIGESVEYRATLAIAANTTFYDVAMTDVLPDGLAASGPGFQTLSVECEIQSGGGPCGGLDPAFGTPLTADGQTVGWYVGDLAGDPTNDRFITVTYSTVVLDDPANTAGAVRTNAATGHWSETDGVSTPATVAEALALPDSEGPAAADLTIVEPRLTVDKAVTDATPGPGDVFTYTVTVTNDTGATVSEAYDIDVTDDVPTGVVVEPSTVSDGGVLSGTGPAGNGTITWDDLGPLAPGESVVLTYQATLAPSILIGAAPLTNTAEVAGYASLPATATDRRTYTGPTASATVTPQFPEFTAAKSTPAGDQASIGDAFPWRIEVTNTGGADGYEVDVEDVLPANWTYVPGSALVIIPQPGGLPEQIEPQSVSVGAVQRLLWTDIGDLATGASAQIDFLATPGPGVAQDPGVGLSVPNTNSVETLGWDATDSDGNADGSYSAGPATADAFIPSADLAMTKSPATQFANAGGTATWTLSVTNQGPDPSAAPFRVVDVLPEGVDLVSAGGPGWSCVAPAGGDTASCTRSAPASLLSGETLPPITVVAEMPVGQPEGTEFTNTATVYPTTYDPDPADNTDSAIVTLRASADLAVEKTTSQPVVAGGDVTYTIQVTNNGPDPSEATVADPIVVGDVLPPPLTDVTFSGVDWSCSAMGPVLNCNRTIDLPPGAAPPITVSGTLPADYTGTLTNAATVTPELTYDPVPSNNVDEVVDTVTTSADLAITKTHTGTVSLGGTVDFTLAVSNLGPSVATGVTVTDAVPAGLTPTAASGTGWTCTVAGQDVTCDLAADLAVGAAPPITLSATVGAEAVPQVVNPGVVTATTPDPDPTNNTSRDTVEVPALVDLGIDKSHTGDFLVGQQGSFSLTVTNAGPTRDPGPVTVTDTLPDGLAFVSGTGTGWTCAAVGQVVTCTNPGPLEVGASSSVELTVDVLAAAYPSVTNTATVGSPATDTDPTNDSDSDTVTIDASVDLSVTKTGTVTADRTATWTIAVRNAGPSATVAPVTLTDPLPAGLAFVSAGGPGWACAENGGTVTCTHAGSIAAGGTATVTLVTTVTAAAGTTITNTASAGTEAAVEAAAVGAGSVTAPAAALAFTGWNPLELLLLAAGLLLAGAAAAWALPRGGISPDRRRRGDGAG